MSHYPQIGQPNYRKDGAIDKRYLIGFKRELSNLIIQANYTEIMVVGSKIHEAKTYRYWEVWPDQDPPFRTFGEWCWAVLHFRERKADALQKIYLDLTAMNVSEPTLYRALKVGWTKLNIILRAARSEVTLIRWLDRVEEHNLTQDELQAEVSTQIPDGHRTRAGETDPPQRPKARSRPAKRERTEEGSDAYDDDYEEEEEEYDYAPPSGSPEKQQIRKTLVFNSIDDARVVFAATKLFNDVTQGEYGAGSAVATICSAWMGKVNAETAGTLGGQVVELEKVLRGLETAYKVPIVIGSKDGLLGRVRDLLTAWGADQLKDKGVKKLLREIDKVLVR